MNALRSRLASARARYAWVSSRLLTFLARISSAASATPSSVRSTGRGGALAQPAASASITRVATARTSMAISYGPSSRGVGTAPLEDLAELEPRVELLAGDDRGADLASALGQGAEIARRDGLLVPERIERLEQPRHADRVHRGQPAVHLDQQIDAGADGIPHGAHRLHHLPLGVARDVRAPRPRKRIELQRAEAARHRGLGLRRVVGRRLRA